MSATTAGAAVPGKHLSRLTPLVSCVAEFIVGCLHDWDHPVFTQLAAVHTHALVLGCLFMLVMLCLGRVFSVSRHARLTGRAFVAWNVGVAMTVAMQVVKGSLQVAGVGACTSPAIAGVSGLGRIVLTIGVALYLRCLAEALRAWAPAQAE